jgi:hypothetical protein
MSGERFEAALAEAIAEHGEDLQDGLDLPVSGRDFAELLLMGIIRANEITKPGAPSPEDRLAQAMRALFGDAGARQRSDQKDDSLALTLGAGIDLLPNQFISPPSGNACPATGSMP